MFKLLFWPPCAANQKTKTRFVIPSSSAAKPINQIFDRSSATVNHRTVDLCRRAGVWNSDHSFVFLACINSPLLLLLISASKSRFCFIFGGGPCFEFFRGR